MTAGTVGVLALLAGAGAFAAELADWSDRVQELPGGKLRSCVDVNSRMMVTLSTPGARQLACYARLPTTAPPGVTRWARRGWETEPTTGWRTWYSGEPRGTWDDVTAGVGPTGLAVVEKWHRLLGPFGRIYSLSGSGTGSPWVAWQLDPRVSIRTAMDSLELTSAWSASDRVMRELLGGHVPAVAGPWSLAVRTDGERWRLGTSRWGRRLESDDKRRRFARVFAELGGDRNFAEGAYKMLAYETPPGASVARAMELEFDLVSGREPVAAEFFLGLMDNQDRSRS